MAKVNVANTKVVYSPTVLGPYYNDYNEDKSFHQFLFRPEYAVQARELSQIQTLLQNQIERFGRHIFVEGSIVLGGDIGTEEVITVNLNSTYANTDIVANNYVNKTIQYSSNTDVTARVILATDSNSTEPPALHLKYLSGQEFGSGDTIKVANEEVYANIVSSANNTANGLLGFINDSIYFVNGYFVKVPKQAVMINKYTANTTNARIGLEKSHSIVDSNDDSSLLDPAAESANFDAPGSTRYRLELILSSRALDSVDDEEFIELMRIENGILKKKIDKPIYSEIEEVLARRTFDESGNYTVKPFIASLKEHPSDPANNVLLTLSSGKAYVYGYEYETIDKTEIVVPKARTTREVLNYNMNMNYGNYVIVDNLNGFFDPTTASVFDIHNIPSQFVDHTSSTTYSSTKIGTGRTRDIEFFTGESDIEARKFEFYFFDTRFVSLSANCASTSNSTYEAVLDSDSSANNNAYVGGTLRITDGVGEGDVRTITSYDGSTKIANTFPIAFSVALTNASTYSIQSAFSEAESFIVNTTHTPGASLSANANITTNNKDNGLANGDSFVTEPRLLPWLFAFPESYITPATLADISFNYRKKYTSVQFTDGGSTAIIAGTDEGFEGPSSSSNVDSRVTDNFLVICTDNQGGSRANGEQIGVTSTVSVGDPEQATFDTDGGAGDTFLASVLAKMDIDGSSAGERVKTLVLANTQTFAVETPSGTFIGPTGSNTSVYLDTGQIYIQNPSQIPNEKESLYISDVISVQKIYDLAGEDLPSAGADITGYTDVTSKYAFDNGQRDAYYDHASIKLKPGQRADVGPLVVCTRYYNTTSDFGYFSVDSYPDLLTEITEESQSIGTGYSLIPHYKDTPLHDVIDFRPFRENASNTSTTFTLEGIRVPISATDFNADYEYYLGRWDLITLSANRELLRVEGTPARFPQYPLKPSRSMVLHTIFVPPFTEFASNVSVKYIDNQRSTMKDITLMRKRIDNIEYYIGLSQLEQSALDLTIEDVNGLDRSKYGIFVDAFTGHRLGDQASDDYHIAVDVAGKYVGGIAVPEFNKTSAKLIVDDSSISDVIKKGDRITLNYTTEPAITQNVATKFTAVADYLFAQFEGQIITEPESDIWKDETTEEVVNITRNTVVEQGEVPDQRIDWPREEKPRNSSSRDTGWSPQNISDTRSWDGGFDTGPGSFGSSDPGDTSQNPGGGGDGGPKMICTELYRQADQRDDWEHSIRIWSVFARKHLTPEHEIGYHAIFKPLIPAMKKSKLVSSVLGHFAVHRTNDLKHIMYGTKPDKLGRIYRTIIEPICYIVGKIKTGKNKK